ncbi:guanylate kinase, partial [Aureobasidium melanogenum]|uniref:Guanylate kinase n=1 Tax=Aureobasidium melanogenum (strain CBS 110374) TaxID=1043003 RepID=A0A074WAI8_AURM1
MGLATPSDRRPVVVSGPSGVGKGTLCKMLFEAHPGTFASTTSHTTRKSRPGEVEGKDYFFVSRQNFSALVSQNAFVEHAVFSGHNYGTSKQTIAEQNAKGLIVVLDIDMQGVQQMRSDPDIDARYVFVKPPSFETLERRLRSRSTESEEDIQKRLAQARVELEYADKPGVHDQIIVNDGLDKAYAEFEQFVYKV